MAKQKNEKAGVVVFISADFNRKLKRHILDLEDLNINTTKSELIGKYAELRLDQEIKWLKEPQKIKSE